MAKMGRPIKDIDYSTFEKLCSFQCTLEEIASFFNVSPDTIERRCHEKYKTTFADAFKKYSANGKISLRRTQFQLAEKNTVMAIWLGKQYLNQRDRQEVQLKEEIQTKEGYLQELQEAKKLFEELGVNEFSENRTFKK